MDRGSPDGQITTSMCTCTLRHTQTHTDMLAHRDNTRSFTQTHRHTPSSFSGPQYMEFSVVHILKAFLARSQALLGPGLDPRLEP